MKEPFDVKQHLNQATQNALGKLHSRPVGNGVLSSEITKPGKKAHDTAISKFGFIFFEIYRF